MFDPLRFQDPASRLRCRRVCPGDPGAPRQRGGRGPAPAATVTQVPQLTDAEIQPALDLSEAFVNIADAVTPGVIRIEAERPPSMVPGNRFNLPFTRRSSGSSSTVPIRTTNRATCPRRLPGAAGSL